MTAVAPTVYLVDDDPCVLNALTRLLSSAGLPSERYSSAEEFLSRHDPEVPGCAVVDLNLPGMNGLDLQNKLAGTAMVRPLIFLTGEGTVPATVQAMKGGAVDFLTKPVDAATLIGAVSIALGKDALAREQEAQRKSVEQRIGSLTPRERQVLSHVVAGRLNKQIAGDLGTVEKTIKVHRGRMMDKMGVRTIADLVRTVTMHKS